MGRPARGRHLGAGARGDREPLPRPGAEAVRGGDRHRLRAVHPVREGADPPAGDPLAEAGPALAHRDRGAQPGGRAGARRGGGRGQGGGQALRDRAQGEPRRGPGLRGPHRRGLRRQHRGGARRPRAPDPRPHRARHAREDPHPGAPGPPHHRRGRRRRPPAPRGAADRSGPERRPHRLQPRGPADPRLRARFPHRLFPAPVSARRAASRPPPRTPVRDAADAEPAAERTARLHPAARRAGAGPAHRRHPDRDRTRTARRDADGSRGAAPAVSRLRRDAGTGIPGADRRAARAVAL